LGSCYIPPNNLGIFRNLIQLLYKNASQSFISRLILVGDFNRPLGALDPEIIALSKKLGLVPCQSLFPTRNNAYLDLLFHGKDIEVRESVTINSPSDHKAVSWFIKIHHPTNKTENYRLPNRKLQNVLSLNVLLEDEPLVISFSNALTLWRKHGSKKSIKTKH